MMLHFISGLPRAGSTLLSALLRQNPAFHAGIQSPLAEIVSRTTQAMSSAESGVFLTDKQRERILVALLQECYAHLGERAVVFDSHRYWCGLLPLIATILPESKIICCLRNPAWILDSIERLVQRNPLRTSKIFNFETGTVYSRVDQLMTKTLVGPSIQSLRQAWFGSHANRIIGIQYESLVRRPSEIMRRLYEALGQEHFPHDFDKVEYDEASFDDRLGLPGMHRVSGPIVFKQRETILPPELFAKHDYEFWNKGPNPAAIRIL
jgi:sulfotransferase